MVRHKVLGIAAGLGVAVSIATMPMALAGSAAGEGAQKSGLEPVSPTTNNPCPPAAGTAQTNGFAILNSPGHAALEPVSAEVAVKDAPMSTYVAMLAQGGQCMTGMTPITTNAQGNGNGHISKMTPTGSGPYYVYLKSKDGQHDLASGPVTLN